jgi:YD repeat-containing protein
MKNKFIIIFLLKFTLSISQNGKDNFFPPTPEANSLIKYVDVPVNYSTGVINYSIPIHNIKLKNLTIPITLSYQSTGLKPSEVASNVGLGWELSAGGKIVQNTVKQNDINVPGPGSDFWNLPNDRDFKLPLPASDLFFGTNPYSQHELDSIRAPGTDYFMFTQIDDYNSETQPDLFYYSTPNKSGKFFFGSNFETKQIPFGKENIIYNTNNNTFEIIDLDGVKYIYNIVTENFNSTTNTCVTIPVFNGSSRNNSFTYYLAQIVTPNNETVEFIYDTVKYNLANDKDYTRYYHSFYGGAEKVTSYYSEITTKVLSKIKVNQDYEVEFLYNKYRKDIKGTVQTNAPKTLDIIKIKYKNEIETYNFDYEYFGISESEYNPNLFEGILSNENSIYRLKLKSFQKTGENPYVFSYYNETPIDRYTTCLDHWGYYNGSSSRYTMNILFGDLNVDQKEPSLEKSKTNVLKNIILPTKGEVEFTYELNDCSDCDISYPSYGWEAYTVYSNTDDNFTNELAFNEVFFTVPDNYMSIPVVQFNVFSVGPATTTNNAAVRLYDDQNHQLNFRLIGIGNQMAPYSGDALQMGKTYRLVLECNDNMENENKFVALKFLTASNVQTPIPSVGGLRIQNIKTKDSNNITSSRSFDYEINGQSSGVLYEKPLYFDGYSYFVESNGEGNQGMTGLINYSVQYSRIPSDLFGFNGYHIFYQKVTEKVYDINDPINNIKVEKYFTFYDDLRYGDQTYFSKISYNWKRGLVSQINEFNKNDIVRKTTFSYSFLDTPAGLNTSSYEPGNHISNPTFPNEFHKRTLDIGVYRRNLSFYNLYYYTSSKLISAWYYMDKKTTEEYFDGNVLKIEEKFKYENPISAQLTSHTTKNSKGDTIETKYFYPDDLLGEPFMEELKKANRINTPVITEQYKAGELFSKNKIVFAKDASTSNLLISKEAYSAKFPNNLPSIANVGSLEKKITYDQYDDKGNILQYTPESGSPVAIIWGYNQTQPIAKIENATYAQAIAQYATDENVFRNNLPNAMITTYTYIPLVGVKTITDPKGQTTTYEYDELNRLKLVKDAQGNILSENQYHYKN